MRVRCDARMVRLIWSLEALGKLAALWLWLRTPWSGAGFAAFFGPDLLVFHHLFVPSAQGFGRTVTHFATGAKEVWLTIDDGPDPADTPRILDLLEQHGARATFFVIGERAGRHRDLVAEIVRRGHEVGHHTLTHPAGTFWCAGPARLGRELDGGLAALAAAGVRPRWFRAPVGIKNVFLAPALSRRDLRCVGWSIRSGDCLGRNAGAVVAHVEARLRPGAIVLMHEGPSVPAPLRVRALEGVLTALRARGYRCVLPDPRQLQP